MNLSLVTSHLSRPKKGGQRDSNPQQPEPQSGALPLSYGHRRAATLIFSRPIAKAKQESGPRGDHCKHWERRLSSAVLGMNKIGLLLLPVLALFALPLG